MYIYCLFIVNIAYSTICLSLKKTKVFWRYFLNDMTPKTLINFYKKVTFYLNFNLVFIFYLNFN